MNINIDIGKLLANMQDTIIRLSPKYIGCLTYAYANRVLILDIIGVTVKLHPNDSNDNITITSPTIKISDDILNIGHNVSTNLTAIILHIIIPSQNGLCNGNAPDIELLLKIRIIPIIKLQRIVPNLTIARNVQNILNVYIPTTARFKNVTPKAKFVK